jgi:hypothetical protein
LSYTNFSAAVSAVRKSPHRQGATALVVIPRARGGGRQKQRIRQISALGSGGGSASPFAFIPTRFGPRAPMGSQMDAELGPPLNEYVSARFAGSTFAVSVPSLV